jgi:hypothetical protein
MTVIVRLAVCSHGGIRRGSCVFCARPYESVGTGVLLWDGLLPMGYVCLWCLAAGPRRVAGAQRRRAARSRMMADYVHWLRPDSEGNAIRRRYRERAAGWDGLSTRLPSVAEWTPADA